MSRGLFLYIAVESNAKSKSDWMYIKRVIDYHYEQRNCHLKPIFMGGKSNLTNLNKITSAIRKARGEVHAIVCADVDKGDGVLNQRIIQFCDENHLDLVWMSQNIEDVFLGDPSAISDQKRAKADKFQKGADAKLEKLGAERFMVKDPLNKAHSSNLMLVLDKYLRRARR